MARNKADLKGLAHFGKMAGGYFFTTLINNAIPFLFLPVLTRYLAPAEYANIALFSFYLALSNALTGISIPAIVSKHFFDQEKEYIARLIGNCILVVMTFSIATLTLIILFYGFLQQYLNLDLLWLALIPIASFSWIVFSLGLDVLRNRKMVFSFTKHQVGNTIINFTLSLFLIIVLVLGWQGRIIGIIISYFASAIIMIIYLKKNGYIRFHLSKPIIKEILALVLPMIPNSFQSVIISQVGLFFIQFYFSRDLLGIYAVGFQIAFSVKLLITALSLSWFPFLYEQLANRKKMNLLYVTRMLLLLCGIILSGVVFVNIFSGLILRVMTTEAYFQANEFIPWLSLGFFFHGLYVLIMPILIKYEKQRYISLVSFLNMLVMIGLNIWFAKLFGYIGIAYAYCLTYFIMCIALLWKSQTTFPLPWLNAAKIW
jgi:O-antigen/teichoic acid export membrane protein